MNTFLKEIDALSGLDKSKLKEYIFQNVDVEYALTNEQLRHIYLDQEAPGSVNIALVYELIDALDVAALQIATSHIVSKHEMLRTRINRSGGTMKQVTHADTSSIVEDVGTFASLDNLKKALISLIEAPIPLDKPHLFRLLIGQHATGQVLSAVFHHVIADWRSVQQVCRELLETYAKIINHQPLETSLSKTYFYDYVSDPHIHVQRDLKKQQYWKQRLQDLNYNQFFNNAAPDYKINQYKSIQLSPTSVSKIAAYCKAIKISTFTYFISCFYYALTTVYQQTKLSVLSPVWGRKLNKFDNIVGPFSYPVPLLYEVSFDKTAGNALVDLERLEKQSLLINDLPLTEIMNTIENASQEQVKNLCSMMFSYVQSDSSGIDQQLIKDHVDLDTWIGPKNLAIYLFLLEQNDGSINVMCGTDDRAVCHEKREYLCNTYIDLTEKLVDQHDMPLEDVLAKDTDAVDNDDSLPYRVAASFTLDPIAESMETFLTLNGNRLRQEISPYNQWLIEINDECSDIWTQPYRAYILILRIVDIVRFSRDNKNTKLATLEKTLEHVVDRLATLNQRTKTIVILGPAFIEDHDEQIKMAQLENGFVEKLRRNAITVTYDEEYEQPGDSDQRFDPFSDQAGHIPFSQAYIHCLAKTAAREATVLNQKPPKVIAVDCDNTLWEGICGEDQLFERAIPDVYRDFQTYLKNLIQVGFLVVLVSKNNEEDVIRLFKEHPDMILQLEDIVTHRINWEEKSNNLQSIAQELSISVDQMVFIDDSPLEIALVERTLQEVTSIQFPRTAKEIHKLIEHWYIFEKKTVTAEDKHRTVRYQQEKKRKNLSLQSNSRQAFLASLNIQLIFEPLGNNGTDRAQQLIDRTSQFHLSRKRYSTADVSYLLAHDYDMYTIDVHDNYGDYGTVGLVICKIKQQILFVNTLLLSCRVLGKDVEYRIFDQLVEKARKAGCHYIIFRYQYTDKNKPAQLFLDNVSTGCDRLFHNQRKLVLKMLEPHLVLGENEVPLQDTYQAPPDTDEKNIQCLLDLYEKHIDAKVDKHTDFFKAGGNSVKAIQLLSGIQAEFHVTLSLKQLFARSVADELFEVILESRRNTACSEKPTAATTATTATNLSPFPLTPIQQRLLFLDSVSSPYTPYNVAFSFEVHGNIDKSKVRRTLEELIARTPSLNTVFNLSGDKPLQRYFKHTEISYEYRVVDTYSSAQTIAQNTAKSQFDLEKGPLYTIKLIRIGSDRYLFTVVIHHIVVDGISGMLLLKEFLNIYNTHPTTNQEIAPYIEYAIETSQYDYRKNAQHTIAYWLQTLHSVTPITFPYDHGTNNESSFRGALSSFTIDQDMMKKLENYAVGHGQTLFTVLLTAFKILVYHYCNDTDISIAIPVANRNEHKYANTIGVFVNTLVIRTAFDENNTVDGFLAQVGNACLTAFEHQAVPFEIIIEELSKSDGVSDQARFNLEFAYREFSDDELILGGNRIQVAELDNGGTKFDVSFSITNDGNKLNATVVYGTDLYAEETINRLIESYQTILDAIVSETKNLSDINILTAKESYYIETFEGRIDENQLHPHLIDLFEDQVLKTPEHIAVVDDEQTYTYHQFNVLANQVSHSLLKAGVRSNQLVGIYNTRSVEMLISIFGILKAGAAFVPIDPDHPVERNDRILNDAGVQILLTNSHWQKQANTNYQHVDIQSSVVSTQSSSNPNIDKTVNDLAYVIYTSGTTGKPKGAMISHKSLSNRITWMQLQYNLDGTDKVLFKTPHTFDVSVWEILWWSISGSTVAVLHSGLEKDPKMLCDAIQNNEITTLHFVPSMLKEFLLYVKESQRATDLASLKRVFVSGEALENQSLVDFNAVLKTSQTKLFNLYGPTEAAIDVTHYDCATFDHQSTIPIGRPIDNAKIYLLNRQRQRVPIGVSGELYIGGVAVGLGYINNTTLTEKVFVKSPFHTSELLYKTGDLAKWKNDGCIEYLGRIDEQVKIRGNRIEIDEVHSAIMSVPDINEVRVFLQEHNGKELAAALVTENPVDIAALKTQLRKRLPDYMIPSLFYAVDAMPKNLSGKFDVKKLKASLRENQLIRADYLPPNDTVQAQIKVIWQQQLGLTDISIDDNYFDIGGNSLRLVSLNRRLEDCLQRRIKILDYFKYPTIRLFSEYIGGSQDRVKQSRTWQQAKQRAKKRRLHET